MSKGLQEQPKSDEVDIIQIFNLIGSAFKSFFNFLYSILEYIFKLFIVLSLFIKKNLKFLIIAIAIGFAGGFVSDYFKQSFFTSTMIVEPNFDTNSQFIESIRLYGQLARSKDSATLSRILDITVDDASKIESITLKPIDNTNDRLKEFNEFIKDADTSVVNKITFDEYTSNTTAADFKQYSVTVYSKSRGVFKKIETKLTEIPVSDYIKQLQTVELSNLDKQIDGIDESLLKVEQLRADYKQLMLQEINSDGEKPTSGNNFYLGSEKLRPTNELELFKLEESYRNKIEKINIDKAKKLNVINIVSGFQQIGTKVKESDKIWYILGALAIALLFLLLKQFNTFLIQYENTLTSKK